MYESVELSEGPVQVHTGSLREHITFWEDIGASDYILNIAGGV